MLRSHGDAAHDLHGVIGHFEGGVGAVVLAHGGSGRVEVAVVVVCVPGGLVQHVLHVRQLDAHIGDLDLVGQDHIASLRDDISLNTLAVHHDPVRSVRDRLACGSGRLFSVQGVGDDLDQISVDIPGELAVIAQLILAAEGIGGAGLADGHVLVTLVSQLLLDGRNGRLQSGHLALVGHSDGAVTV